MQAFRRILASVVVTAGAAASCFAQETAFQEKKLIAIPESVGGWDDLVFSPGGGAVACVETVETDEANKQAVAVNGKRGEAFDECRNVAFSADGAVCVYEGVRGEQSFVVAGAKTYGPYDGVGFLVTSPVGGRVAYWATVGEKNFVVVDGKPGSIVASPMEMMAIGFAGLKPVWSPDGKRVAYAVTRGEKMVVAMDDKVASKEYDGVGDPVFGPEGSSFAFPAKRGGNMFVVVGDKEGQSFNAILGLSYGAGGPVYMGDGRVVVGERTIETFEPAGPPVPGPDGATAAFWAKLGPETYAVVVGEQPGEAFENVDLLGTAMGFARPVFGADGKTVAYLVTVPDDQTGMKTVAVIGGRKSERYDAAADLAVSADRKSFAYVAAKDETYFVVAGDRKSASYDRAAMPVFAPDGKKCGFYALQNEREVWWKILE